MRWDIGIDLGTESVRMADGKQGPFKESAAALAFREGRDTPVYGGDAAEKLEGRVCEGIEIQRPLKDGVLENNFTADRMFHWIYRQAGRAFAPAAIQYAADVRAVCASRIARRDDFRRD